MSEVFCVRVVIMSRQNLARWQKIAERQLNKVLTVVKQNRGLRSIGPKVDWKVELLIVGQVRMRNLNRQYRGKDYPTDVLSFYTPEPLFQLGFLGELVICLPVMESQAKKLKHSSSIELDVLLVHGLLHLLRLDHEKNSDEARVMAKWELKCLKSMGYEKYQLGLIDRAGSGKRKL
jgi:probable rRNA maturation factor